MPISRSIVQYSADERLKGNMKSFVTEEESKERPGKKNKKNRKIRTTSGKRVPSAKDLADREQTNIAAESEERKKVRLDNFLQTRRSDWLFCLFKR